MIVTGTSEFVVTGLPSMMSSEDAADTYERYRRRFESKIFAPATGYAMRWAVRDTTWMPELLHLSAEQSKAMKSALLNSVTVVDEGYLAV